MLKYSVFSSRLKVAIQSTVLRDSGREFHVVGLETLNALLPSFVLVRGMIKSLIAAECRRLRNGSRLIGVTALLMYAGDCPICAMYIRRANLNWMRSVLAANATQRMPD